MIAALGNLIALFLYASGFAYLTLSLARQRPLQRSTLLSIAGIALLIHGLALASQVFTPSGLHLGFFVMSSLIFWAINLIVLISSLKKPLHNLFLLLFPLSALSLLSNLLWHGTSSRTPLDFGLASHIVLSVLAYSLLTIATLQALLLAWQHHQLKHKHATGRVRLLPPLQTMESLLFELLWAGQILLTLSILSGIWFLDDIFAQHLVHKTAFSIAAWLIYALLLWGRHQLGWRGYTAIRWTLVGFALLMLAYFGSKMVLELILQRV